MEGVSILFIFDWWQIGLDQNPNALLISCTMIGLMSARYLYPAYSAVTLALAIVFVGQPMTAQSHDRDSSDVLHEFLPEGGVPKDMHVKPADRSRTVQRLKMAQSTAHGERAQQAAFLLAAFNVDYDKNRDYLFHIFLGCNYSQIRYGCDDMTGEYLIYLFEHGHTEILAPLMKTSIGSYNAAGSEAVGAYLGELVEKSPESFILALKTLQVPVQKRVCEFAGLSDGGGLSAVSLARTRKGLRRVGGEVALRCLAAVETANKPD